MVKQKTKAILNFNHIEIENPFIEELKNYYISYHKKSWCYQKKFKKYRLISTSMDIIMGLIAIISTSLSISITPIASAIAISLAVIPMIKNKLKIEQKREKCRNAAKLLNQILAELKSEMRNEMTDINKIREHLSFYDEKLLDINNIPNLEKYGKLYDQKFKL